jgi:hypothetical protein
MTTNEMVSDKREAIAGVSVPESPLITAAPRASPLTALPDTPYR